MVSEGARKRSAAQTPRLPRGGAAGGGRGRTRSGGPARRMRAAPPRHDARDQRRADRPHGADRLPHHRGTSGHLPAAGGRPGRSLRQHRAVPRAAGAAPFDLRDPGTDSRRRRGPQAVGRRRRPRRHRAAQGGPSRSRRGLPDLVDRQPGPRGTGRRVPGRPSAGRALHAFPPPKPLVAGVPAGVERLHRRVVEARNDRLPVVPGSAAARSRLQWPPAHRDLPGRRRRRSRPGGDADPLPEFRPGNGACRGASFRRCRGRRGHGHRRRHRRHQLRRLAGPQGADPLDPGDVAGPAHSRPHDGVSVRRRAQRRRRRRLHRLGRSGRHASCRPGQRGVRAGAGLLRPGRQRADRDRRRARPRLYRCRLLPGRCHRARHGSRDGGHCGKDRRPLGRGRARGCGRRPRCRQPEHGPRHRGHHDQPGPSIRARPC